MIYSVGHGGTPKRSRQGEGCLDYMASLRLSLGYVVSKPVVSKHESLENICKVPGSVF